MKKTISILFAAAALLASASFTSAQNRGPYLTNAGKDNWFIGIGGGINLMYDNRAFGKVAPAAPTSAPAPVRPTTASPSSAPSL